MSVSIEKLVKAYIKIRDQRSELAAKFKEEDNVLSEKVAKIKSALLEHCMYEFIREHDVPEFFEKRLNQTNVRQFLVENPDLLPKGLNVDSEYTVSVRKK